MEHVLKGTTVLSFNYFFFTFCIGFVYNYQFVIFFEVISFTMAKYIALINSFWYMNELFMVNEAKIIYDAKVQP